MGGRVEKADRAEEAEGTDRIRFEDPTLRPLFPFLPPLPLFPPLPPSLPASPRPRVPALFTYSLNPSRPPSLPNPLSRYPPKPLAASKTLVQLIQSVPALTLGAMSRARLMFSVHTLAARPYRLLLASSTASSGVRKVI